MVLRGAARGQQAADAGEQPEPADHERGDGEAVGAAVVARRRRRRLGALGPARALRGRAVTAALGRPR